MKTLIHGIYLKKTDGIPYGAIYSRPYNKQIEVFGYCMKDNVLDKNILKELLNALIYNSSQSKYIIMFDDGNALDLLKEIGFKCIGRYKCYKVII